MKQKVKSPSSDVPMNGPVQSSPGQEKLWKFFEQMYKEQDRMHDMLVGKILTVIDATTESDTRLKAIKDLVHNAVREVWAIQYELNGQIHERMMQHYNPTSPHLGMSAGLATPSSAWLPPLPTIEEYNAKE